MRGVVTRVTAAGVYVQIKSIFPGIELGPLDSVKHRFTDDPPASTERFTTYKAGDRVLVSEDQPNDFIVVGLIQ